MARGTLESIMVTRMRDYLVDKAYKMIKYAKMHKETGDITVSQLDAYGAVIFYKGKSIYTLLPSWNDNANQKWYIDPEGSTTHKGWREIPDGTGEEWGKMVADEIKRGAWDIPKNGFALVVFNAAFYSSVHENRQNYQILSMITSDMQQLQGEFKGSKLRYHNLKG